ncbi:unnamed protein product [Protopolystoma xenopodis]|uniref:Uncharacterized protein n=1 Tax=Protopolystoma xenopodis TaxID=117903 RepID=A0A3S5A4V6_9PLAT|nr:unnamed protein product [Protopolystoma xenopodis]
MKDESSARIHRGSRAVRREPIRTSLQSRLQGNPPQLPVEPTYETLLPASSNETKVWCVLLSGFHENPPHSTLAFSPPFTLVLGMLIKVYHIVAQSFFPRSYQSLPLAT